MLRLFSKLSVEQSAENYYVYVITDKEKIIFETGVCGALNVRLNNLKSEANAAKALNSNAKCLYLLYWEELKGFNKAMERAKEIKKLSRKKKEQLITRTNPEWKILNDDV